MGQYIIIGILIAILILQICFFFTKIKRSINEYEKIFLGFDKESYLYLDGQIQDINDSKKSDILKNIISNLNEYLKKNKDLTSDYHLMKDIVDRNVESQETQISTILPFPLYAGLMGTMLDIFVGILSFVLSGGVSNLLKGAIAGASLGGEDISQLLAGVALAMLTGVAGIVLTTAGTYLYREARKNVEKQKNVFLSWMQAELLPELSTDFTSSLAKLSNNLNIFNATFSSNTKKLDETLSKVNQSYKSQVDLLEAIKGINIVDITSANISVYEHLKNCTNEINQLGQYLMNSRTYLENIITLNENLKSADDRVQTIENLGKFFRDEVKQIEVRKSAMSEAAGNVNETLVKALSDLENSSSEKVAKVSAALAVQNKRIEESLHLFLQQPQLLVPLS